MSTQGKKPKNWLFIGFLIISSLMIISLVQGLKDLTGTRERFEKAEAEVQKLEEERQKLERDLEGSNQALNTEQAIRDQLGLAKPGEIVVILPDDIGETDFLEESETESDLPNWKKWAQVFGF